MRKAYFTILAVFLALSAVTSCTKDREDSAYIPQFTFRTPDVNQSGGLVYTRTIDSTNTLHIEFYGNPILQDYVYIDINKSDFITPGTYAVDYDPRTHSLLKMEYYTNASHVYTATAGTLTITRADNTNKLITGTFQFTGMYGREVKQISYGTFYNVSYAQ